MNALPIWDDEPHLTGAPVLDAAPDPTALTRTDTTPSLFDGLPADPRRSALVAVLEALGPDTSLEEAALALLAAIDVADTVAGIARVDTNDAVLQQRIARIISGANLPSRGPGTRAREVLALLLTVKTVGARRPHRGRRHHPTPRAGPGRDVSPGRARPLVPRRADRTTARHVTEAPRDIGPDVRCDAGHTVGAPTQEASMTDETRVLDLDGLQALIDALRTRGYTVMGPTVRQGAIVTAPVSSVEDLPRGWGDEQDAGTYRLRRRDDDALFGFASGAQSAKPVFFPTSELLWRGRRDAESFTVEPSVDGDPGAEAPPGADPAAAPPFALLGVRSCDVAAIAIHDRVLASRGYRDVHYAARRADAFVVAVTCSTPGGTCFCVSMGTGPKPSAVEGARYDLALTELLDGGPHRFLVEVGSERGAEVLTDLPAAPATAQDESRAADVAEDAALRMGRSLDTDGLREILYAGVESPRWDDVAARCLACTNCTMVCPTCFCTTVEDVSDLTGTHAERHRVWDSCFSADFSYIHGGTVRETTRSRYRQWMTHKLAAWIDQFGTSGCVGCGRCITWCPAAIDITEEAAALRGIPQPGRPTQPGRAPAPAGRR